MAKTVAALLNRRVSNVKYSVKILRREVQHHENLDTVDEAWFAQIHVEIPYDWEVARDRRELKRRQAND